MKTQKTAVVTMVYGDAFLKKWVDHYAAQVGRESLFVMSHGPNPTHDEVAAGTNHIVLPRAFTGNFDAARFNLLNNLCNGLLEVYSTVICTDVDELITPDPGLGVPLADYLRDRDAGVIAPVGFNVITPDLGTRIDWDRPVLEQAPLALYHPAFSKPVIRRAPCRLLQGGHRVAERRFEVDPNLWLFHLKFADSTLHGRYDGLIAELNAIYGDAAEGRGILQWKTDKTKVQVFMENLRGKAFPEMTPQENTAGLLQVLPDAEGRSYGVDVTERAAPFLLPQDVRECL